MHMPLKTSMTLHKRRHTVVSGTGNRGVADEMQVMANSLSLVEKENIYQVLQGWRRYISPLLILGD